MGVVTAALTARAAEAPQSLPDTPVLAVVNGSAIPRSLLDEFAVLAVGRPNPFDEASREDALQRERALSNIDRAALLEELVIMEVMAQAARERGLDRLPSVIAEAELAYKSLLQRQLVRGLIGEMRVEEDELKKRYHMLEAERRYNVSDIVLKDKDTAVALITELNGGADFHRLARKRKATKGWLMQNQMTASVAAAVSRLEPGSHHVEPVQSEAGWHVVRLNDVRKMEKPPIERMRNGLRTQILQEKLRVAIQQLKSRAVIEMLPSQPATAGARQ